MRVELHLISSMLETVDDGGPVRTSVKEYGILIRYFNYLTTFLQRLNYLSMNSEVHFILKPDA